MSALKSMEQVLAEAREDGDLTESMVFDRITAEGLDFSELTCRRLSFHTCRFTGCDFSGAAFYDCDFTDCHFTECRFSVSYWKSCRLQGRRRRLPPEPVQGLCSGRLHAPLRQLHRRRLGAVRLIGV